VTLSKPQDLNPTVEVREGEGSLPARVLTTFFRRGGAGVGDDGVLEVFGDGEVCDVVQQVMAKMVAKRGPQGIPVTATTRDWSLVALR
jgi:hypothetical protein